MKHGRCAVLGRWRRPSCTYVLFCPPADSVIQCSQRVCESVNAARDALLFSANKTERLEQRYCIKFCQKLGARQVETIRRFSGFSAMMSWASHKLSSDTTDSKMAACLWILTLFPVGSQQAEITSSLTTCGLWPCRIIVSPFENLRST
jgi:hypothetical protein